MIFFSGPLYSKAFSFIVSIILLSPCLLSQSVINYEKEVGGLVKITEDLSIPKIKPGYTAWSPSIPANGAIVFFHSRRDTLVVDEIINYATEKNLVVIYVTSENPLEFLFTIEQMANLEHLLYKALKETRVDMENVLFCGMSLAGTRALRMTKFAFSDHSKYKIEPRAIAICDAPLDMERFYHSSLRGSILNFHSAAANEGTWVSAYLKNNLAGDPFTNQFAYQEYSPYSYRNRNRADYDKWRDIPIRAYTEPDVNWWIETRRKDYYDMNSVDMAGLVNELRIRGNAKAELILTDNRGFHPDGSRHPHSWSIVDERDLVDWFVKLIQ